MIILYDRTTAPWYNRRGVRSHCRFRNRGTEYVSEYGMTWMRGSAAVQSDNATEPKSHHGTRTKGTVLVAAAVIAVSIGTWGPQGEGVKGTRIGP